LKHYAASHPEAELRLFAATTTRLEAFQVLDLSFARSFGLWSEIEKQPEIEHFHQFQVHDAELKSDVLAHLSPAALSKIDREHNNLPWDYMRKNGLIPEPQRYRLTLTLAGERELSAVAARNNIPEAIWSRPTISFLWRYRKGSGAINSFGQKSEQELVAGYSKMFRGLIERFGCHVLVCGMNVVTDETNRARTDNKYPPFGLELPPDSVTYMKGLSWPLELEIASRATIACGHSSGFTEGLWLKRGRNTILMDAQPHYLAKIAYHRMPLFHLNRPWSLAQAAFQRSPESYGRRMAAILRRAGAGK
jgi:hypothetical protein